MLNRSNKHHYSLHSFRATDITAYLKNSGKLEVAQHIANHESPRTTKLYDRRQDDISLDEIERIAIGSIRCRFQLKRRLSHFQRYFFQLNRDWSRFFQLNRRLLVTAKASVQVSWISIRC